MDERQGFLTSSAKTITNFKLRITNCFLRRAFPFSIGKQWQIASFFAVYSCAGSAGFLFNHRTSLESPSFWLLPKPIFYKNYRPLFFPQVIVTPGLSLNGQTSGITSTLETWRRLSALKTFSDAPITSAAIICSLKIGKVAAAGISKVEKLAVVCNRLNFRFIRDFARCIIRFRLVYFTIKKSCPHIASKHLRQA